MFINVKPPQARHSHPNTFILIIKPTTPIFKIQIAQIKATALLIIEENGLEVFEHAMGVILHLASANCIAYPYIPPRPPSRLIRY